MSYALGGIAAILLVVLTALGIRQERESNALSKQYQASERIISDKASYLNLLTDRTAVIEALKEMNDYGVGGAYPEYRNEYSFHGAIDWLATDPEEDDSYIIYGHGGWHRYIVKNDGTIIYSVYHGATDANKACSLGFLVK